MLTKVLPKPSNLIKNELDTLSFLRSNKIFAENHQKFTSDVNDSYIRYKEYNALRSKKKSKNARFSFRFESWFKITINKNVGKAYIGAQISADDGTSYNNITYFLAICEDDESKNRLLKKIHFDYSEPNSSANSSPIFHSQMPGEPSPLLKTDGYNCDHLYPWLSEPRLPYYPMSLALLLNIVLKEFPDDLSSKFIEDSYWRSRIKKNEELLLEPYYKKCSEFIKKRKDGSGKGIKSSLLTNDFYYGN